MSLHEESDGLLSTNVTWQDVELAMQNALNTTAKFGDNKSAINISDMKGFMSRIALIDPDWTEKDEKLPERFCVKIASQLQMKLVSSILMKNDAQDVQKIEKMSLLSRQLHNREVDSYKLLMKLNHPDIPYTKIYTMKPFDNDNDLKGFIISDYIDNIYTTKFYESLNVGDILPAVGAVATLSGLSQGASDKDLKFVNNDAMDEAFAVFFSEDDKKNMNESIQKFFTGKFEQQADKLIKINQHYGGDKMMKKFTNIDKEIGIPRVLTHGDLWQSNMLHSENPNGGLKFEAVIDWQSTSMSAPGMDLSRILLCLDTVERRRYKDEVIELYYTTFIQYANTGLIYQQVYDSYHLYLPLVSMFILPGIIGFKEAAVVGEEEKEKVDQIAMAKIIGIMEDVLAAHDHNLSKYPDFVDF